MNHRAYIFRAVRKPGWSWRRFFQTPTAAAALTLPMCLAIYAATLIGTELVRTVQWAWIPTRLFHSYQACCLLVWGLLVARFGVIAGPAVRGRELTLASNFVGQSALICGYTLSRMTNDPLEFWGLEPPAAQNRIVIFWVLASLAFTIGCWRGRAKRIMRLMEGNKNVGRYPIRLESTLHTPTVDYDVAGAEGTTDKIPLLR